jgi:hypothetical protein
MRTKTGGIRPSISFIFDKDILKAFIPSDVSVKYRAIITKAKTITNLNLFTTADDLSFIIFLPDLAVRLPEFMLEYMDFVFRFPRSVFILSAFVSVLIITSTSRSPL